MLWDRGNYQGSCASYQARGRTQRRGAKEKEIQDGRHSPIPPGAWGRALLQAEICTRQRPVLRPEKDFWAAICAKCSVSQRGSCYSRHLLFSPVFLLVITPWISFREPFPPSLLNPHGLENLNPQLWAQSRCLRAGQSPQWVPVASDWFRDGRVTQAPPIRISPEFKREVLGRHFSPGISSSKNEVSWNCQDPPHST